MNIYWNEPSLLYLDPYIKQCEMEMNDINKEISISYGQSNIIYDQDETDYITEIFSYSVACDIMNDDPEPQSVIVKTDMIGLSGKKLCKLN